VTVLVRVNTAGNLHWYMCGAVMEERTDIESISILLSASVIVGVPTNRPNGNNVCNTFSKSRVNPELHTSLCSCKCNHTVQNIHLRTTISFYNRLVFHHILSQLSQMHISPTNLCTLQASKSLTLHRSL
jgi:hypothetical protein